ncbi:glycerol-3-phosphate dehydrogenase/oxidase [Ferrimonas senticii]|uniref:glycerol-3-phosphate dehydrogenase/oxidase n=1 Tax=Ferrimonas senticii TaxID=394566 RepID=UPI0004094E3E|nr:FAD-dependent oxidoreductase [Ferrimonas senticii]
MPTRDHTLHRQPTQQPLDLSQLPSLTVAVEQADVAITTQPSFDLVVIGGGITGAGIAREAARRRWRTLLLEQRDFAGGTSNLSSKMIHGGLRYLAQGQWQLTQQAAQAREALRQRWPDLICDMPYLYPYRNRWQQLQLVVGLWLYHWLAKASEQHRPQQFDRRQLQRLLPLALPQSLGANRYFDALCDDAALVLRTLQEAVSHGALLKHYCAVSAIEQQPSRCQLTLANGGQISTKVVVNATGVWGDQLTSLPQQQRLRPQRGSHLLLPHQALPINCALTLHHPHDNRVVFAYPWLGCTVLGTTDLEHLQDKTQPCRISAAEQRYLLALLPHLGLPKPTTIIASWSGLRPIICDDAEQAPSAASREHLVWQQQRLISVSGGKLTTFAQMANDTLTRASQFLPKLKPQTDTPLQATIDSNPQYLFNTQVSTQQLTFWCQHGAVVHLSDLLVRRTRLGWLLGADLKQHQAQIQRLCQPLLPWDDQQWQQQWQDYWQEFTQQYAAHPIEL